MESVKSLENYSKLTIRISKVRISRIQQNSDNGYGYRHSVTCDEIPECRAYGSTVSEALDKFQRLAELWIRLST